MKKSNKNFTKKKVKMFFRFFVIVAVVFISSSAYSIPSNVDSKIPIIVYLKGTCCAGKFTLIQSLRRP